MEGVEINKSKEKQIQKSYFDVLGICCSSEVPLIEKILQPLEGVQKVSVFVPSKTVVVVHNANQISQLQIVKALNQARLEASIRAYNSEKIIRKWPSPNIQASGLLLILSLFKRFCPPLRWLALTAVVIGLPQILLRSFAAARRFTLDINILILIAVGGAVALRDFTEAAFIVFLFTIAQWLESMASLKATAGMNSLMSLTPQKAILAETGEEVEAKDVMINTIIAVKAGELIPIDGVVVEGRSEVDESSLTGESFPVAKHPQSPVWAGTLNIDGYISVKTTAKAEHSAAAKMARMVDEAQASKSKTQRIIDSCAKYYTPVVVLIAASITLIPLMLKFHNAKHWFKLSLVLLVSACPCALVLSTPVATFCAFLKAAKMGLFVKGGDVFEDLAKTKVVAFDKTGTITRGEFSVTELKTLTAEVTMPMLLYWVSSIESKSSHPMASALVDYARRNSIIPKPEQVDGFHIYPGEGVSGEINGRRIYIGNKRIAMRAQSEAVPQSGDMKEVGTEGYVFLDAIPIGVFLLFDTCRTGAKKGIEELKAMGMKTAMLTGDSESAALYTQKQLGNSIEAVYSGLFPEDKVRTVEDLKKEQGSVTMVGDGMNDAPALAIANVGISMGISGSAVAMETSHITLMSNDICKVPKIIKLARSMSRKIVENIIFSLITKLSIIILAVAGHPLLWAAALADVGTCLIVITNSMMLMQTETKNTKCLHKSCGQHSTCHNHHRKSASDPSSQCCKSKSETFCCAKETVKEQGESSCDPSGRCCHSKSETFCCAKEKVKEQEGESACYPSSGCCHSKSETFCCAKEMVKELEGQSSCNSSGQCCHSKPETSCCGNDKVKEKEGESACDPLGHCCHSKYETSCCGNEKVKEQEGESACEPSSGCCPSKSETFCCGNEKVKLNHDPSCCKSNMKGCQKEATNSSSHACKSKRCCSSYKKECSRKEAVMKSGIIELQQITIV
ncbi:Cadmium/zinc-transporting ATPase HMA2 [Apostasia shenzhenica]|uniref:Cadmium/zinc-transporting ATPase HMA2 n=1 Tax=Apostasia shenzhenica TaxID=1088818 RepID=A0A2I0APV6_9ASPA|nr:Cadmium/zinc-transporting ATPase HMA2 [Apostasia shenzhenica]